MLQFIALFISLALCVALMIRTLAYDHFETSRYAIEHREIIDYMQVADDLKP